MTIPEIIQHVKRHMLGRMADEQNNTALMAETALCDGDHLEIGTLHGGSAIVVALAKREAGYSGRVVCIDPLDGYYPGTVHHKRRDPISGVPVSFETIEENMRRFGVDLEVIPAYSIPFPLPDRRFATAYIDGDHWNEAPTLDFFNVAQVTDRFITFDNCDAKHPDVQRACRVAEKIWTPYTRKGITCIVKRP